MRKGGIREFSIRTLPSPRRTGLWWSNFRVGDRKSHYRNKTYSSGISLDVVGPHNSFLGVFCPNMRSPYTSVNQRSTSHRMRGWKGGSARVDCWAFSPRFHFPAIRAVLHRMERISRTAEPPRLVGSAFPAQPEPRPRSRSIPATMAGVPLWTLAICLNSWE